MKGEWAEEYEVGKTGRGQIQEGLYAGQRNKKFTLRATRKHWVLRWDGYNWIILAEDGWMAVTQN